MRALWSLVLGGAAVVLDVAACTSTSSTQSRDPEGGFGAEAGDDSIGGAGTAGRAAGGSGNAGQGGTANLASAGSSNGGTANGASGGAASGATGGSDEGGASGGDSAGSGGSPDGPSGGTSSGGAGGEGTGGDGGAPYVTVGHCPNYVGPAAPWFCDDFDETGSVPLWEDELTVGGQARVISNEAVTAPNRFETAGTPGANVELGRRTLVQLDAPSDKLALRFFARHEGTCELSTTLTIAEVLLEGDGSSYSGLAITLSANRVGLHVVTRDAQRSVVGEIYLEDREVISVGAWAMLELFVQRDGNVELRAGGAQLLSTQVAAPTVEGPQNLLLTVGARTAEWPSACAISFDDVSLAPE